MLRLSPDALTAVFRMFGRVDVVVREVRSGYRNTSYAADMPGVGRCNLLVHKPEPQAEQRIRRTNWLGNQLASTGLPVRTPLDERVLSLRVAGRTYHASLYNYLPGRTIPWEAYTMKHVKLLGWALGSLHGTLRSLPTGNFPLVYDEYRTQLSTMAQYFGDNVVAEALLRKLELRLAPNVLDRLDSFLQLCAELPESQLLHMDFVRGNVLFGGSDTDSPFRLGSVTLTGIIDFEKAAVGHPLFDVARTLAFLLVDCSLKTPQQLYKYFLRSGYQKRGVGKLRQTSVVIDGRTDDVLEGAITLFLLHDFYKFLRANPYEALHENHHYVRTRDILVERGLLHPTKNS